MTSEMQATPPTAVFYALFICPVATVNRIKYHYHLLRCEPSILLTNSSLHLHRFRLLGELADPCCVHCPHPEHILLSSLQTVTDEPEHLPTLQFCLTTFPFKLWL